MADAVKTINEYCVSYFGGSKILILYIICLAILCYAGKEKRRMLVYPSILIMLVILNPVFYKYVFIKLLDNTYWRMLWMIPVIPVICSGIVQLIVLVKNDYIKIFTLGLGVFLIVFLGKTNYKNSFTKATNLYKVPDFVTEIADNITLDTDCPKILAPMKVGTYIRQYNSNIIQEYGRNVGNYIAPISKVDTSIEVQLNNAIPDYLYVFSNAYFEHCDYVITDIRRIVDSNILSEFGYIEYVYTDKYAIYKHLGEWTKDSLRVTQYSTSSTKSFYTIEDQEGRLIIIDGGSSKNKNSVKRVIEEHNNKVDAWILTNLTKKNAGAFLEISKNKEYVVDNVYSVEYDLMAMDETGNYEKEIAEAEDIYKTLDKYDTKFVTTGDVYDINGIKLKVLSAFGDSTKDSNKNWTLLGAMSFVVEGSNEKFLFASNTADSIYKDIYNSYLKNEMIDYAALYKCRKSSIKNLFGNINPKVVFYDTVGKNLQFNEENHNYDNDLFQYYYDKGVRIYNCDSAPNVIIIR